MSNEEIQQSPEDAQQALHTHFRSDMEAARLTVTDVTDLNVLGNPYTGPAVLVRDFNLVRGVTKLNLLTAAAPQPGGSFYVIPVLEPVTLD